MGLERIAKRIEDVAFRLAMTSCGCGRACDECAGRCDIPPSHALDEDVESSGKDVA